MARPKTITMLELRKNAAPLINEVRRGRSLLLTYRGRAVARIEPVRSDAIPSEDPFYRLWQLADARGETLSDRDIDRIVYGG